MHDRTKTVIVTASATALAVVWRLLTQWRSQPPIAPLPAHSTRERQKATTQKRACERTGLTAKKFLDAIALTRPLIHRHPTLPILETVLLEPGSITATDLESRLTVALPELTLPPVCVNAALLRDAVRRLKEPLTLTLEGDSLVLNDTLHLPTSPASEYPVALSGSAHDWEARSHFTVPLRFSDVLPAMARDASRPQLHGVCFDLANGAIVASDGHRLHRVTGSRCASGAKHTISAIAARTLVPFAVHGVQGHVCTCDEQRGSGEIDHCTEIVFSTPGMTLRTRTCRPNP